jgi:hypothetical protein
MNLVTVEWVDAQKKTILVTLRHHWTWKDWDSALETILEFRAAVPYPVNLIVDATDGAEFPTLRTLPHITKSWEALPNDNSRIVVVGLNELLWNMTQTISRLFNADHRVYYADTLAEATSLIAEQGSASSREESVR